VCSDYEFHFPARDPMVTFVIAWILFRGSSLAYGLSFIFERKRRVHNEDPRVKGEIP